MAEQWEIEARLAVLDLIARYNANGDTGRFDQVVELFADDAVMVSGGRRYEGQAGVREVFTSAGSALDDFGATVMRHSTATHQIDVLGPAEARSYCYFTVLVGTHGLDHWGRYIDRFGVRDGRWRFTERRILIDGRVPGGWAASRGLGD
jgi:hypothetical protein